MSLALNDFQIVFEVPGSQFHLFYHLFHFLIEVGCEFFDLFFLPIFVDCECLLVFFLDIGLDVTSPGWLVVAFIF